MRTRVILKSWARRLVIAPAIAAAFLGASCSPDATNADKSSVLLIVTEVVTQAGGGSSSDSAFLLSDVIRVDDPAGTFNDNATITLRNTAKNPLLTATSHYDDVVMERYAVRYYRSDGRNVEGVDVPYAFQGPLGGSLPAGEETDVALILVRHQAKDEPPLTHIRGGGGQDVMTCFGEVTLYGRTLSGEVVSVTTTISITFADFGD